MKNKYLYYFCLLGNHVDAIDKSIPSNFNSNIENHDYNVNNEEIGINNLNYKQLGEDFDVKNQDSNGLYYYNYYLNNEINDFPLIDENNDGNKYNHQINSPILSNIYSKLNVSTNTKTDTNVNSINNIHSFSKLNDYYSIDNVNNDQQENNKLKLYIEVLICTDYSIYQLHKSYLNDYLLNSNNNEDEKIQIIVNNIKEYYMKVINGVCFIQSYVIFSLFFIFKTKNYLIRLIKDMKCHLEMTMK